MGISYHVTFTRASLQFRGKTYNHAAEVTQMVLPVILLLLSEFKNLPPLAVAPISI